MDKKRIESASARCPDCGGETAWQKQDVHATADGQMFTERSQSCLECCGWSGASALFPWARNEAGRMHAVGRAAREEEQRRCLAWVERLIAVWADPEQAGVKMSLGDVVAGIGGDKWPPGHD